VAYADDPEGYRRQLEAKLQPQRIRATLGFAGLFQITHEMIKQSVLEEVRLFYRHGFDETGWRYDEEGYKRQVLSRAPKDRFRASLLWLVDSEAITLAEADRLDAIYGHRHELSHDLIKYIVDPEFEPSLALFTDALAILKAIRRFWSSVEQNVGSFEQLGDVDLDEVVPLSLMILQQCIEGLRGRLGDFALPASGCRPTGTPRQSPLLSGLSGVAAQRSACVRAGGFSFGGVGAPGR
jgi:hypothetical protein